MASTALETTKFFFVWTPKVGLFSALNLGKAGFFGGKSSTEKQSSFKFR